MAGIWINGRRMTQELQLNISNLFKQENLFIETFNSRTGKIENTYQVGFMILPQYSITF